MIFVACQRLHASQQREHTLVALAQTGVDRLKRRAHEAFAVLVPVTFADARSVMIEGESGLLSVSPSAAFEPSNRRVLWPTGAVATVVSAEEPDGVRGHQFDAVWADGDRAPTKEAR